VDARDERGHDDSTESHLALGLHFAGLGRAWGSFCPISADSKTLNHSGVCASGASGRPIKTSRTKDQISQLRTSRFGTFIVK
jgi:hypothetical protein